MDSKKTKYLVWLLGFTILLSCFIWTGFQLSADSIGAVPSSLTASVNMAYAEQGNAITRPEIDLQIPEMTEIALFALG
ncbi:MAG: hypothetical protein GQ563_06145 [Desulfuromusa sp.]|nr:hypothetical protein [Desulfuromusa sp.]